MVVREGANGVPSGRYFDGNWSVTSPALREPATPAEHADRSAPPRDYHIWALNHEIINRSASFVSKISSKPDK